MSETTTCTSCNAEYLDYRQEGHDKLCIGCAWDAAREREAHARGYAPSDERAEMVAETCQFTHETRAGYCVTHQERLRSGVCVTGRAMQELWEALSPTPPQPADEAGENKEPDDD